MLEILLQPLLTIPHIYIYINYKFKVLFDRENSQVQITRTVKNRPFLEGEEIKKKKKF